MNPLSDAESSRHNEAYLRGWALAKPYMLLGAGPREHKVGWLARRRLNAAIASFGIALSISPDNWSTLWALGKVHQRLRQPGEALAYFERAYDLERQNVQIPREAAMAALALGNGPKAIEFCTAAIALDPADAGLVANLALAYLINGDTDLALDAAEQAVERDPHDVVSGKIVAMVRDVRAGRRPVPRTLYG